MYTVEVYLILGNERNVFLIYVFSHQSLKFLNISIIWKLNVLLLFLIFWHLLISSLRELKFIGNK